MEVSTYKPTASKNLSRFEVNISRRGSSGRNPVKPSWFITMFVPNVLNSPLVLYMLCIVVIGQSIGEANPVTGGTNETTQAIPSDMTMSPHKVDAAAHSKVKVSVFYETLCPDSIAFIVNQLWPVHKSTVGSIMEVDLVPYGKASYTARSDTWDFQCQHGKRECQGNKIHACVLDSYPSIDKYLPFVFCSMSSHDAISGSETCAYKNSLDWMKISMCAEGNLGSSLLHANGVRTESLNPKLVFVPWIRIDDTFSEIQLEAALDNLMRVVCDKYMGPKPSDCPVTA